MPQEYAYSLALNDLLSRDMLIGPGTKVEPASEQFSIDIVNLFRLFHVHSSFRQTLPAAALFINGEFNMAELGIASGCNRVLYNPFATSNYRWP